MMTARHLAALLLVTGGLVAGCGRGTATDGASAGTEQDARAVGDGGADATVDGASGTRAVADLFGGLPACNLVFRNRDANITAPAVPLTGSCPGERTDDGMGHPFIDFQPVDTQAGVVRTFNVWQFETRAPAGTVLRVEDGFDELASRGVSVRYLEFIGGRTNIWRGVRGTVTIRSTRDEAYTLELAVEMLPDPDPFGTNRANGGFAVDGTIASVLP